MGITSSFHHHLFIEHSFPYTNYQDDIRTMRLSAVGKALDPWIYLRRLRCGIVHKERVEAPLRSVPYEQKV